MLSVVANFRAPEVERLARAPDPRASRSTFFCRRRRQRRPPILMARFGPQARQRQRRPAKERSAMRWQPRDSELLRAVWQCRALDLPLFAWAFPPQPDPQQRTDPQTPGQWLNRRLRLLYDYGYLDRRRVDYGGRLVYLLTRAGAEKLTAELTAAGEDVPDNLLDTKQLDTRNARMLPGQLDHHLGIARVRLALESACRDQAIDVAVFRREGEGYTRTKRGGKRDRLKAEWTAGDSKRFVIPDAFVIVADRRTNATKPKRSAYFVEVDRSTMPMQRMADKFERYHQLYNARMHVEHFKVPSFRVLTVCRSPERAANLHALVRGEFAPPGGRIIKAPVPEKFRPFLYFTDESTFTDHPANVFARVWWCAKDQDSNARAAILADPFKLAA